MNRRHFLIIPAAGSGRRMHSALPKQYLEVAGKPLLWHALARLGRACEFRRIVVAVAPDDERIEPLLAGLPRELRERVELVEGGERRSDSVLAALRALQQQAADADWVLVHDAVRPCIHGDDVARLLSSLADEAAGGLLAQPVRDTIKQSDASGLVTATLNRSQLWQAATPQMFRYSILLDALSRAQAAGIEVTDEAAAVEAAGRPVRLVTCRSDNIKVTYPEDLALAESILREN